MNLLLSSIGPESREALRHIIEFLVQLHSTENNQLRYQGFI